MHIPQSLQTFTELEQICLVPQNIISPGTSKPSIEITQDTLVGGYLLTKDDIKLSKADMYNYMMFSNKYNGNLPEPAGLEYGQPYWTGKQLYSLILPDINIMQIKTVKIVRGNIIEGHLNNQSLGSDSAGLIKQIYNAYGTDRCVDFLNNTEKLITRWMAHNSFSISFGDSIVDKAQRAGIKDIIKNYLEESFDVIKKAQHGIYATELDDAYKKTAVELGLMNVFSKLTAKVQEYIFERISQKNNFYIAGDRGSGAKGKSINVVQIMGCVGQQEIWGSRIDEGFTDRTLPHFPRNDMGPDAKGFCRNSYIEGLTPSEMFFHAMGGRTGTIDTAIKSVTGDTPIIIMEQGIMKHVLIGDWIDDLLLKAGKDRVQNYPEKEMELLELDYEAHIPTTDLDGNVSWGIIKNVTRHDPGKELYEIKTSGGRSVIVTESHSLLIWNGSQYERKSTPDVRCGDFVPVTRQLGKPPQTSSIPNVELKIEDNGVFRKLLGPAENQNNILTLTNDTGLFIGIFISCGIYKNEYYESIEINTLHQKDLNICKMWLNINGYNYDIEKNSSTIICKSSKLLNILKYVCGLDDESRFIHPQCFNAPELFIKGLVEGLNVPELVTKSHRLLNDINICLSLIGEFMEVNLIDGKLVYPNAIRQIGDTVLDEIIQISTIDISKYPKVYDLTIPSTLNFGLANGLHVVDTADSGYTSRKFIKAAEDLMVAYDFTVRNASNHIVQFAYGDDNFDPIKLEKVTRIELYEYDNARMEKTYKFESVDDKDYFETFMKPETVSEMMAQDNYKTIMNAEYDEMMQLRDDLRYRFFKNTEAIGDISTYVPINLHRVLQSQLIKFNIENYHLSDLTPQYVIQEYDAAMKEIVKYLPEKSENWKLFKVIFKSLLASKRVISEYRMSKLAFDSIITLIKEKMMYALVSPGEMVGIIGSQTLGEISTQLTLNSVTYETEIIVRDSNKRIRKYQIGEFIEREIRKSHKVDYMDDKDTTYAECAEYFEIPSCDEDGNVTWKRIEAVTKHPVINKDGSNVMLKITTEEEREVIATKAKSFLKLVNGKIIGVDGDSLKVGDYLPVSTKCIDFDETTVLNLKCILPPTEYVYGSELEKAKAVMNEHHWWKNHANKTFVLPHKRSDTVVQLASDRVRPGRKTKSTIKDGNVYMLLSNNCDYNIPEVIELDYNFGYLIGAYCAEGCMTLHQISISNNDSSYYGPIEELCKKWNITTKVYKEENKNQEGWTSQNIRIYSTILCRILEKLCGKLSHNKFVSDLIVFSNKTCLRGFLDAYIGGDGCVNGKNKIINMTSVSKNMLIDVQQILNIFGIYSRIYKPKKQETNNRGSLDIKQLYRLNVENRQAFKLANIINMNIDYKKTNTELILKHTHTYEYGKKHVKIPNEIDGEIIMEERIDGSLIDVLFDKIKSIEEVENTTKYAYDLTIEQTKNFNLYNHLCFQDTFHLAGIGAGSVVITEGIPRLREIINLTKNLKNRNMKIYLKEEYATKDGAKKIQAKFAYTQLKDILSKTEILYDNKNGTTDKAEDMEFIKSYKEFADLFDIDNIDESTLSPWILRLTFDKESLMNRKITVQEIQETIKESYHNDQEIDCVYSDDSAHDVVMRIKIKSDNQSNFLDFIKDFEKQLIELSLRGITDIHQVEISDSNIIIFHPDGVYQAIKEVVLKTSGSNLLDILADDAVDVTRTETNDILEFYEVFGIEATRELIYRELMKIYMSNHPNPRHVQMLADIMTYRGKLMQIDRHGLNKNPEIGPIAKASFEEVMNIFTKAALFAEKDNMKGVSANIFAGQFCKSGTNSFELMIDEEKIKEIIDIPEYVEQEFSATSVNSIDKVYSELYEAKEVTEQVTEEDFEFGFGIENIKEYDLGETKVKNTEIMSEKIGKKKEQQLEILNKELNFESMKVDEPEYSDNNLINFEKIEVETPDYGKEEEKKENKKKEKTTKNITEEVKPKKLRVYKKKDKTDK
jgi:DNA-directed RNA polymerase beta' subunit